MAITAPTSGRHRRDSKPEYVVIGDETFRRNDVAAAARAMCERTYNRHDKAGNPFIKLAGTKFRPERGEAEYFLSLVQKIEQQPKSRRRHRT
jgi:hypothetical protein